MRTCRTACSASPIRASLWLLLCLTITRPAFGQGAAPKRPPAPDPVLVRAGASVPPSPRVLALYYGWYGTPLVSKRWVHYEGVDEKSRKIASHVNYPASGPYDSTDAAVMLRHVQQAKTAGIQTLVCSWWGRDDPTDRAFRALLPIAAENGITLCPLYERVPQNGNPDSLFDDLRYLLTEYGASPGLLRVQGKAVLFLFGRVRLQLTHEQWAEALLRIERERAPGVLAIADGSDLADALVFDGLFQFDPRRFYQGRELPVTPRVFQTLHQVLLDRCRRFRRIPVVTVMPGRDETERRDNSFYRLQWTAAAACKDAWVFINSFNLWHTGTEIEPSEEYGDTYLAMTGRFTAEYRKAAPAAPAPPAPAKP